MRARFVRLGWFFGIWGDSVAVLGVTSLGLRFWLA
ncbi:MAG TPA: DUF2474 family protein [Sphingobium sp.]